MPFAPVAMKKCGTFCDGQFTHPVQDLCPKKICGDVHLHLWTNVPVVNYKHNSATVGLICAIANWIQFGVVP